MYVKEPDNNCKELDTHFLQIKQKELPLENLGGCRKKTRLAQ